MRRGASGKIKTRTLKNRRVRHPPRRILAFLHMQSEKQPVSTAFVDCPNKHRFSVTQLDDTGACICKLVCPECRTVIEKMFPHRLIQPEAGAL